MSTKRNQFSLVSFLVQYNTFIMLAVLVVVSSFLSEHFLTAQNTFNLLRQLVPLFLVSIGMLLVILTGGIDLSVGSVAAIGGMVVAMAMPAMPFEGVLALILCVLFAISIGALLGAFNGILVARFNMAPFVVTLAMMTMARGIAYMLTNGQPVRFDRDLSTARILKEFGSKGFPFLAFPGRW